MINLFKGKQPQNIPDMLKNDEVKAVLEKFISDDLPKTTGIIIIFECQHGHKREYYHLTAGLEPIAAIGMLDQCHHRIQHEGLPGY